MQEAELATVQHTYAALLQMQKVAAEEFEKGVAETNDKLEILRKRIGHNGKMLALEVAPDVKEHLRAKVQRLTTEVQEEALKKVACQASLRKVLLHLSDRDNVLDRNLNMYFDKVML